MSTTTALTTADDTSMLALLGIDTSVQEADQHLADTVPMHQNRVFKVDFIGKTRMVANTMGQFMPVPPGEEKSKTLVDTLTLIPLQTKFWGQKSEEVEEEKDGKKVKKMRTVCETVRRPVLDEAGKPILDETGNPVWMQDAEGKDVGYASEPGFGWKLTADRFCFQGSEYGDCTVCPHVKNKKMGIEPENPCKTRGSMTAIILRHDGVDVEPYIAELTMNYTSTIRYRQMLDDVIKRKAEFGTTRPVDLILRVSLVRNEVADNAFYEIDCVPVVATATIETKKLNAMKGKAIEKYLADKARVESLKASTPAPALPAAEPATSELPF